MTPLCTRTQADAYYADVMRGLRWAVFTDTNIKDRALNEATKIINGLNLIGEVTTPGQENAFPRNGDTTIPQPIVEACADIALLLAEGYDPDIEAENAAYETHSILSARVQKNPSRVPDHIVAGVPSLTAWNKIRPYMCDAMGLTIRRV